MNTVTDIMGRIYKFNKVINIGFDFTSCKHRSYYEVLNAIDMGLDNIDTCCLNFFSFEMLDQGYDVMVYSKKGKIVLSELLENNKPYTDKEIRYAHDVCRMLIVGSLRFL